MPVRGSDEDNARHHQAVVGLSNGLDHRSCCQGTYGDEESDYTPEELDESDRDVETYYESLQQNVLKLRR